MRYLLLCSIVFLVGTAVAFADTPKQKKLFEEVVPPRSVDTRAVDCAGAISIGCNSQTSGNNTGLTDLVTYYGCTSWYESGGEVVYELVLSEAAFVSAALSGMSADLDVFILGSCSENDCLTHGDLSLTTSCLDPGTYYIVVDGYSGASSAFDLDVTCTSCQTPDNDDCARAIDLCASDPDRDGAFNLSYTTVGMNDDYDPGGYGNPCTGYSASGGDVVYVVCLEAGGTLDVTQTGNFDMSLYLITDCADPAGSCVAGSDECCTGASEYINYTSAGGGTYYLIVDGYSSEGAGTLSGSVTGCCESTATEKSSWGRVKKLFK